MLLIRSDHDEGTHYMYEACNPLISVAADRGLKVIKVEGEDINLKYVAGRINKSKPKLIFFNGHGSASAIFNNDNEEFINLDSAHLFSGTVAYTRACDCICELGRKAMDEKCKAFIGYKKNFWIPRIDGYMSRPLKDPAARPVIEASNIVVEKLLKGSPVEEAVTSSKDISMQHIKDLIYSNDPFMSATLPSLINNHFALDFKGSGKVKAFYSN